MKLYKGAITMNEKKEPSIKIVKDGPYIVNGGVPLKQDVVAEHEDGKSLEYRTVIEYNTKETYTLCRCGASKNKPYCDGEHAHIHFDGTETASKEPYLERAEVFEGPVFSLYDDGRCAYARLCHQKDGDVWTLTETVEGNDDEQVRETLIASCECPAGRLELHNNETGEVYEQEYEPSIIILEDQEEDVSGPLFVRGNIKLIGADGDEYEIRNRYALCRCGLSSIKPFCKAQHVTGQFEDGSDALEPKQERGKLDESFDKLPER